MDIFNGEAIFIPAFIDDSRFFDCISYRNICADLYHSVTDPLDDLHIIHKETCPLPPCDFFVFILLSKPFS